MAKVQISIDDSLLTRLDNYADETFNSRSGVITLSIVQYLNQNEIVSSINTLAQSMKLLSENGQVDEDSKKKIEFLSQLIKEARA